MDGLEFALWGLGIIVIGLPLVFVGIPCIAGIVMAWIASRGEK